MRLAGHVTGMGAKNHGCTVLKFLGGQVVNVWTGLDADSVHSRFF